VSGQHHQEQQQKQQQQQQQPETELAMSCRETFQRETVTFWGNTTQFILALYI